MSNIMRDLKRHTSEKLHDAIKYHKKESRREWMLWMMERAALKNNNEAKFQLWQAESHPIELSNSKINLSTDTQQHKTELHICASVGEAGFVKQTEDWLYSSAIDYNGSKGLLDIIQLEPLLL